MALTFGVWVMLITGVLLNAGAQLLIKAGTTALGGQLVSPDGIVQTVFRVLFQPFILGGLAAYVVSVGLWIVVLSKAPVSVAYPMLSIGYIVNAFLAYFLFGEALSVWKLVGIGVIVLGVFILARAGATA
ncbi:4-amino-4-deoxy-L-arabinose transferase [Agromyces allii]|uniref:SMR family transporter n=1 Tax=Agromyces allii TaxID=393607 RepID=A0ABN2Q4I7_9MICO|nr:4-amino-4-deoxy-L-arabinose transferase [Agromyces allii]